MTEYDSGILEISDDSVEFESFSDEESVIELSSESDSEENTSESASDLLFVDLRKEELVEVKEHTGPNATPEELATISNEFLNTPDSEDNDKLLNYSNVTIRKRNRFRHEETAVIQTDNNLQNEKKSESTPKTTISFLKSLDDEVPLTLAHPESVKFKKSFKKHRDELVDKLMSIYNERIFENKLSHIPCTWTKWIGVLSGSCRYSKRQGENYASIFLSDVLLTSAERVRDVLLHEMCHAAVYTINKQLEKELGGHGVLWQSWGHLANKVFPDIPLIQRYHYYKMSQKFKYKCTICRGSSLSNSKLKTDNLFCALCHGPVELFRVKMKNGKRVTVALRKPGSFALFVKENYKLTKTPDVTHAGVMKALSEKYSKLSVAQKQKYRKSFGLFK